MIDRNDGLRTPVEAAIEAATKELIYLESFAAAVAAGTRLATDSPYAMQA